MSALRGRVKVLSASEFEIIAKVIYVGIDCEGNIHIVLRKNDAFWVDVAVKFLKTFEGEIVKFAIKRWVSAERERATKDPTRPALFKFRRNKQIGVGHVR